MKRRLSLNQDYDSDEDIKPEDYHAEKEQAVFNQ